uniref:DNA-directed RNA polymerase n=1 Tax=Steinernema glaseri TaxID=37863 RepID=A0A1I7YEM6_9BILA
MATDNEGNPFPLCPRASELEQMQMQTQAFRNLAREHEDFLISLEKLCGEKLSVKDSLSVYGVFDAIMILKKHNQPLPEWVTPALLDRLNTIFDAQLMLKFGQTGEFGGNIIRLRGGTKAKTILNRLEEKWSCFASRNETRACLWYGRLKFYGFATHDMTLWGMLTPFGIVEKVFGKHHEIDHAASVTFELWNVDGKPMVNVVFLKNPGWNEEFQSITHLLEGCPEERKFCPLPTVIASVRKFFPEDVAEECKPKNTKKERRSAGYGRSRRADATPTFSFYNGFRCWNWLVEILECECQHVCEAMDTGESCVEEPKEDSLLEGHGEMVGDQSCVTERFSVFVLGSGFYNMHIHTHFDPGTTLLPQYQKAILSTLIYWNTTSSSLGNHDQRLSSFEKI